MNRQTFERVALGFAIVWIAGCVTRTEPERTRHPTGGQNSTSSERTAGMSADSDKEPTPQLFERLSLIPYQFGAKSQYKITGADFFSLYSVVKKADRLSITADIPDTTGQMVFRGILWRIHGPVLNGYAWTPRAENMNGIDLASQDKITSLPGFSFDDFKKHEAVIQFGNGFAVNLFGAIIEDKSIVKAGSSQTYLSKDGRKLHGRMIRQRTQAGATALEEVILQ